MNDNIKIGADLHAGDGGYSIGTQEKYDEFAKGRNQSLGNMRIKQLKEQAMEWVPNMADPDTKIRLLNAEKFAELIVRECVGIVEQYGTPDAFYIVDEINRVMLNIRPNKHFGVKE